MRKLLVAVSVLVVLAIAVPTAIAQNQIALNGSSNDMTFSGAGTTDGGSDWYLNMNGVTGTANGSGEFAGDSGSYLFTQTGKIKGTYEGSGVWGISGGALTLTIGSLLSGSLQLIDLSQNLVGGVVGTFNDSLQANLTGLSGSLAKYFPKGAVLSISIDLDSPTSLVDLGMGTTTANISTAELDVPKITPEPASMVLVGSGLLLLGGLVRRRRRTTTR
jgi:hypothetical protein